MSVNTAHLEVGPETRAAGRAGRKRGIAFLLGVVWLALYVLLYRLDGFWFDEWFSAFATDPHVRIALLLHERILPDTNPPLFQILLLLTRRVLADPMLAAMLINAAGFLAALVTIAVSARRHRRWFEGIVTIVLALFNPALLALLHEARGFSLAASLGLMASWFAFLSVTVPAYRPPLLTPLLLGGAASLLHVYAGLHAASIGGAALIAAWPQRRQPLALYGIALAAGALIGELAWFVPWHSAFGGNVDRIAWIPMGAVAQWGGVRIPAIAAAAIGVALGYGLRRRPTLRRPFLFGVSILALMIAAASTLSLIIPILHPRYFVVAAPLFGLMGAFILGEARRLDIWPISWRLGPRDRWAVNLVATMAVLTIPAGIGLSVWWIHIKPAFRGGPVVARYGKACGADSIAVPSDAFMPAYSLAAGLPESTFRPVGTRAATPLARCAVLGWAEHQFPPTRHPIATEDPAKLLAIVGLPNDPSSVVIERFRSGFVVLRRDAESVSR